MTRFSASTAAIARSGYELAVSSAKSAEHRARLYGSHQFIDRSRRSDTVLIVLAGYKEELWDVVFPRLIKACPPDWDVCLVSAGKFDSRLADVAAKQSWSYLTTKINDVSLVQNLAIHHHPNADIIVKVDEDVMVAENTFADLYRFHRDVNSSGVYKPAFVAPTLNINGASYRDLLSHLNLLDEYEREFGTAKVATRGIPVTEDNTAARWIWKNCGNIDFVAKALRERAADPIPICVQFSIGLILYSKSFWLEIDRFPVPWHRIAAGKSTLGADEDYLCRKAILSGRPMIVAPTIFAGHFSFGRQYTSMLNLLQSDPAIFAPAPSLQSAPRS